MGQSAAEPLNLKGHEESSETMYVESASIYILIDPRTQEIRYVGKTCQTLNRRLSDHCRTDRNGGSHKERWIAKLRRLGYRPIIQFLQSVHINDWPEAEQYWIGYYRSIGCRLTNSTLGGDGGNTPTAEARAKLSASKTGVQRPPFDDQWRQRMSESHTGKEFTKEHCENIAAAKRGVPRKEFSPEWRYKLGARGRDQTHCSRGHEFTPENTRITKNGKRVCRECDKIRAREYRRSKSAD